MSSRSSGSRVDAHRFAPSPALAPFVECMWVGRWRLAGQAPHTTELLGDPCVHLAFERGSSRVVGVHTRLWRRTLEGDGFVRAAKLAAGASRAFLATRASALTNRLVPLSERWPAALALEPAMLAGGDDDDERAATLLDAWLCEHLLVPRDPTVSLAVELVRHVAQRAELTTTLALTRASGLSERPLQRLFRDYVGASPKWVIRRFRLQEVAARLERGQVTSLAALAAELGYSDHAHLTRDFRAATGKRPSSFARDVHR